MTLIRRRVTRLILALGVVGGAWGFGMVPQAEADQGPCGFVEVTSDSTTSTVTVVSHCGVGECSAGPFVHQPPTGAGGITAEVWVCSGIS